MACLSPPDSVARPTWRRRVEIEPKTVAAITATGIRPWNQTNKSTFGTKPSQAKPMDWVGITG